MHAFFVQANALDNLPHDIRQRASAVFHIAVNYAFTMLKWTACENLPADLDSSEGASAAADRGSCYVTMLFNDETHTYDQVHACDISYLDQLLWLATCIPVCHTDC